MKGTTMVLVVLVILIGTVAFSQPEEIIEWEVLGRDVSELLNQGRISLPDDIYMSTNSSFFIKIRNDTEKDFIVQNLDNNGLPKNGRMDKIVIQPNEIIFILVDKDKIDQEYSETYQRMQRIIDIFLKPRKMSISEIRNGPDTTIWGQQLEMKNISWTNPRGYQLMMDSSLVDTTVNKQIITPEN